MLLISLQKHVLWALIRTPRLCTSNGEISIYLNRCVLVMCKNVLSGVFVCAYWKEMLQRDNFNRYHSMYFCENEYNIS